MSMNHPLLATIASLDAALDEVAGADPIYLTTSEKQQTLLGCSRLETRIASVKLRVLAAADDIAIETGDRSTAHWLAAQTRDNPGTLRRHAALADALDRRWTGVADAFAAGELNLAQVRVITDALDALPSDLGDDLRAKAETPDRDRGRHPGTPGAAGLRDPAVGVPGPRHRRGSRLPAAAGRGTPRLRGDPALHPPPRRRVRRPARPDPRPRRRPPGRLPRRLHRPPTPPPPPRRHGRDAVRTDGSRRPRRRRPAPDRPATRRGVRRAAGEHPHHQPAPPRRHRHQR